MRSLTYYNEYGLIFNNIYYDVYQVLNEVVDKVKILLIGLSSICLIIGILMMSTMFYFAVYERRIEIVTFKALGFGKLDIYVMYILEAFILSIATVNVSVLKYLSFPSNVIVAVIVPVIWFVEGTLLKSNSLLYVLL